ncbi:hypothetical protein Bhyg_12091 [Pseudolycoriella hygida]|uniref:Regulatory protein zeste n=1 Tax=Pseudolycoriella hygida TaxID=35572 RepID=A0A9Q0S045_9DIPT|nr:hypothetical protein Bhyg_12091 [Pseudolycoriella hygida]
MLRNPRMVARQKEELVRLLQSFFIKKTGNCVNVSENDIDMEMWEIFASRLNLLGPQKSEVEWKTSLYHLKLRVKGKLDLLVQKCMQTKQPLNLSNLGKLDGIIAQMFYITTLSNENDTIHPSFVKNEQQLNAAVDVQSIRKEDLEICNAGEENDFVVNEPFENQVANVPSVHDSTVTDLVDLRNAYEGETSSTLDENPADGSMFIPNESCGNTRIAVVTSSNSSNISEMMEFTDSFDNEEHPLNAESVEQPINEEPLQEVCFPSQFPLRKKKRVMPRLSGVPGVVRRVKARNRQIIASGGRAMRRGGQVTRRCGRTMRKGTAERIAKVSRNGRRVSHAGGPSSRVSNRTYNFHYSFPTVTTASNVMLNTFHQNHHLRFVKKIYPMRISVDQKRKLLQLVEQNFLRTVGRFSGFHGVIIKRRIWEDYAKELNQLGPPFRSG